MAIWTATDGAKGAGTLGPFSPASLGAYEISHSGNPPAAGGLFSIGRALSAPINLTGITGVLWHTRLDFFSSVFPLSGVPIPALSIGGSYSILLDDIQVASGSWNGSCSGGGLVDIGGGVAWFMGPSDGGFLGLERTETVSAVLITGNISYTGPGTISGNSLAYEMHLLRSFT